MAKRAAEIEVERPNWTDNVRKWNRDAADEEELLRYFYQRDAVAGLLNGGLSIVTGRKGTGKTAIVQYITETAGALRNQQVAAFDLQNFGVFGQTAEAATEANVPDLYPHWLLVLLTELAKLMLNSSQVTKHVKEELTKALEKNPSVSPSRLSNIDHQGGWPSRCCGHWWNWSRTTQRSFVFEARCGLDREAIQRIPFKQHRFDFLLHYY